jgi:hypothetical protein
MPASECYAALKWFLSKCKDVLSSLQGGEGSITVSTGSAGHPVHSVAARYLRLSAAMRGFSGSQANYITVDSHEPVATLLAWSRGLVAALKQHPTLLVAVASLTLIIVFCIQVSVEGAFGPPGPLYFAFDVVGLFVVWRVAVYAMMGRRYSGQARSHLLGVLMLVVVLTGAVCSGTKVRVDTIDPGLLLQDGSDTTSSRPVPEQTIPTDSSATYCLDPLVIGNGMDGPHNGGLGYRLQACPGAIFAPPCVRGQQCKDAPPVHWCRGRPTNEGNAEPGSARFRLYPELFHPTARGVALGE